MKDRVSGDQGSAGGGPTQGRRRWGLIISAAGMLIAAQAFSLLGLPPVGLAENRPLAERPALPHSADDWAKLPGRIDAWVQDHYPIRTYAISLTNYLRYRLGYSGVDKIIVGRKGWLFYNDGVTIQRHMGQDRLTSAQVDLWVSGLRERIARTGRQGIEFYSLIAPTKQSVYPELMPDWAPAAALTEGDELLAAARRASIDRVIYPRRELTEAKRHRPVYGRYDTHWNGFGAHIAYTQLIRRIYGDVPAVGEPLPITGFEQPARPDWAVPRDLALMLGVAGWVKPDHPSFTTLPEHDEARTTHLDAARNWMASRVIETDAPNELTLLLVRDSFATEMLPFLKRHFRKIVLVHLNDGFFRQDLIDRFRPDVVVLEIIESGARYGMAPL